MAKRQGLMSKLIDGPKEPEPWVMIRSGWQTKDGQPLFLILTGMRDCSFTEVDAGIVCAARDLFAAAQAVLRAYTVEGKERARKNLELAIKKAKSPVVPPKPRGRARSEWLVTGVSVLCDGEGSTVFRVDTVDLAGKTAWLQRPSSLGGMRGHGWESFSKLRRAP